MINYLLSDIQKIKYDRNTQELQLFLMHAIAVAGKQAKTITKALNNFFYISDQLADDKNMSPFETIKFLIKIEKLKNTIIQSKLGQHKKLERAYAELAFLNIDLKTCNPIELEKIHGLGMKTSRFFITFNRNEQFAILDRHILAELREVGFDNIPKNTPQNSKEYSRIENIFMEYAKSINKNITELDLEIWNKRSKNEIN